MSIELALRFVGGVVAGIAAWEFAVRQLTGPFFGDPAALFWSLFAIVAASFGIVFLLIPYVTTRPYFWLLDRLTHVSASDMLIGGIGLLVGLVVGALLGGGLMHLPGISGQVLPAVATVLAGYLGMSAALAQKTELQGLLGLPWDLGGSGRGGASQRFLVDTSAVIDGRVADIAKTGFLAGQLVVPRFVLGELQRIADAPDPVRRARGRRGLEVLTRLQKDTSVQLEISDAEGDSLAEVDAQLVSVAKALRCPIVTNDYNLNRVAGLQGVRVLNVNELANAVKSVVLPGEEMLVKIIQEGKEFGQGVGYLDDGTMVVVENGRHLLNTSATVVVNRVLQTVAGRMIFAQTKHTAGTLTASRAS